MKKILSFALILLAICFANQKGWLPQPVTEAVNAGTNAVIYLVDQVKEKYLELDGTIRDCFPGQAKNALISCENLSTLAVPYEKDVELPRVFCSSGVYFTSDGFSSGPECDYTHMDLDGDGLHLKYQGSGVGSSGYAVYRTSDNGFSWNHYGYVTFGGYMQELVGVEDTVVLNICNFGLAEPLTTLLITTDNGVSWSTYGLNCIFPELGDGGGVYAKVLSLTPHEMTLGLYLEQDAQEDAPQYFHTATLEIQRNSLRIIQEEYGSQPL